MDNYREMSVKTTFIFWIFCAYGMTVVFSVAFTEERDSGMISKLLGPMVHNIASRYFINSQCICVITEGNGIILKYIPKSVSVFHIQIGGIGSAIQGIEDSDTLDSTKLTNGTQNFERLLIEAMNARCEPYIVHVRSIRSVIHSFARTTRRAVTRYCKKFLYLPITLEGEILQLQNIFSMQEMNYMPDFIITRFRNPENTKSNLIQCGHDDSNFKHKRHKRRVSTDFNADTAQTSPRDRQENEKRQEFSKSIKNGVLMQEDEGSNFTTPEEGRCVEESNCAMYEGGCFVEESNCAISEGGCCVEESKCPVSEGGSFVEESNCAISEGGCCVEDSNWAISEGGCCVEESNCSTSEGGRCMEAPDDINIVTNTSINLCKASCLNTINDNMNVIEIVTHKFVGKNPSSEAVLDIWVNDGQHAGFLKCTDLFPDKIRNLEGRVVKVTTLNYVPFVVLIHDEERSLYGGSELLTFMEFAKKLNFTWELVQDEDNLWGAAWSNGSGNGVIGKKCRNRMSMNYFHFKNNNTV
jgi:hypothetical protein